MPETMDEDSMLNMQNYFYSLIKCLASVVGYLPNITASPPRKLYSSQCINSQLLLCLDVF